LARVKKIAADKWAAACPIDQSRNGRPIAVREMSDGRVLLYPFCGCNTGDVLSALGLSFSDLFPEPLGEFKPERRPFDPVQVLAALEHEITVAVLIASDVTETGRIDGEQEARLRTVARRLNSALEAIGGGPVLEEIKRIRRAAPA
jgi:hypothetical protein